MRRMIWILLCFPLIGVLCWALGRASPTALTQALDHGELIRLHVVANSDTTEDQALKLEVRDAVIAALSPYLSAATSAEEAEAQVRLHQSEATEAAKALLISKGRDDAITTTFSIEDFPERDYGGQIVPAGRYKALRVVIGEGAGANWWCVLYPPLCFIGEDCEGLTEIEFESIIAKWVRGWFRREEAT